MHRPSWLVLAALNAVALHYILSLTCQVLSQVVRSTAFGSCPWALNCDASSECGAKLRAPSRSVRKRGLRRPLNENVLAT